MSLIKIFLPENIIKFKEKSFLYGQFKIETNACSYYIINNISTIGESIESKDQRHENDGIQKIGQIVNEINDNDKINNIYIKNTNLLPNILLNNKYINNNFNETTNIKFNIILYDTNGFQLLSKNETCCSTSLNSDNNNNTGTKLPINKIEDGDNVLYLTQLIKKHNELKCMSDNDRTSLITKLMNRLYMIILYIKFLVNPILKCLEFLFGKTAVVEHAKDWIKCVRVYNFNNGKSWTIVLDVIAGWIIMFWLLYMGNTSHYLMKSTEVVIENLRYLLESLKGNPVGLKLNTELNHFLLDCFKYHVDLWATFLVIVSPAIHYFFLPLAIIGCFGLSFQLAMLSDLLLVISLHAHCFYIYAAVLYHVEIVGIKALWRVFFGRRKNILKDRVESYEYTKNQLFLATMFFAAMLFILPTVLVYYIVFASLRFCVYCITYTLMIIQRKILLLPVYIILRWITGTYVNLNSIELKIFDPLIQLEAFNKIHDNVLMVSFKPQRCSPWSANNVSIINDLQLINDNPPLSIDNFFMGLLKSDMLGFIRPKRIILLK